MTLKTVWTHSLPGKILPSKVSAKDGRLQQETGRRLLVSQYLTEELRYTMHQWVAFEPDQKNLEFHLTATPDLEFDR
jgi:hypothetical protein